MPIFFAFNIKGVVQGVGFRPFVLREARKLGLRGYVQNTGEGVRIVCDDKERMLEILERVPKLARVDSIINKDLEIVQKSKIKNKKEDGKLIIGDVFEIRESEIENKVGAQNPSALRAAPFQKGSGVCVPPDVVVCDECLRELFESGNRRYGYFHIGCTDCGPRFSMAKGGVFDRKNTAMSEFQMCEACRREYEDPQDRRFHMQGICCEDCGPGLKFEVRGLKFEGLDAIKKVASHINLGEIVSMKGVGGFSLVCNTEELTVQKLRKLIHRKNKPLALMGKNIDMIKKFVHVSGLEQEVLEGRERPIVLLRKRFFRVRDDVELEQENVYATYPPQSSLVNGGGSSWISENDRLGFLLPYTPLHYLLFQYLDEPIIFTSANLPNHPVTIKKEEQFICSILDYNRDILHFSDDSIVKCVGDRHAYPLLIRRSRGFVSLEIAIPSNYQTYEGDILAVGAELKNIFAIKTGDKILCSQELGNTSYIESFSKFQENIKEFLKFTGARPEVVLCDLNPAFNVSRFARNYVDTHCNVYLQSVQHHKAHVFSVALEHNLTDFIGIVADGTGWGEDECVWGGEIFCNDQRIGSLEKQVFTGGDMVNIEPIRVLVGILKKFLSDDDIARLCNKFDQVYVQTLLKQCAEGFNGIESSSCGRVLDAVSLLLGICDLNEYEGRCTQLLEAVSFGEIATVKDSGQAGMTSEGNFKIKEVKINKGSAIWKIDTTYLFQWLVEHLEKFSRETLAMEAQMYLARGFWEVVQRSGKDLPVVWSGGCAYNHVMTSYLLSKGVKMNKQVSCGDGGIALGQIGYFLSQQRNIKR